MTASDQELVDAGVLDAAASQVRQWLAQVPLYRRLMPGGLKPDPASDWPQQFKKLPIISKQEIRDGFPANFLPEGVPLSRLLEREMVELERTSGTSEAPVLLLLAKGWWEEQERVVLNLHPMVNRMWAQRPDARRVTLTSPSCNHDIDYRGVPCHSDRIVGQALHINLTRHPFLWPEAQLARMVEETLEWQPAFLDVDPVYGVCFARFCQIMGVHFPSLQFVVSSYEYLSVAHRRYLERVWRVPVVNLYGSTETGHLLVENGLGRMVPRETGVLLELVELDQRGIGDLLVTTLTNDYMPLIRYRIGDLARRVGDRDGGPYYELHGRAMDALEAGRGGRVTVRQVDECLSDTPGIIHYQVRQETATEFLWLVVGDESVGPKDRSDLQQHLQERLSERIARPVRVNLELVDYIPCEVSGKFRLVQPLAG